MLDGIFFFWLFGLSDYPAKRESKPFLNSVSVSSFVSVVLLRSLIIMNHQPAQLVTLESKPNHTPNLLYTIALDLFYTKTC